ncbi:MAG: hypothetical protein ACK4RK_01320 [Gemmataceae bacterium]
MLSSCLLMCLFHVAADAEVDKPLILFAEAEWYQKARGEEQLFDGFLELNPGGGKIGAQPRFNAYWFRWTDWDGRKQSRELYAPGKEALLAAYLDQRVRLWAKMVNTDIEGKTYHELWPARLEVGGAITTELASKDGIHARANWQPAATRRAGLQVLVIRDGKELAKHMNLIGGDSVPAIATAQMARLLRVADIDWGKHMLVCVAAGLQANGADRLLVTRAAIADRKMTLIYHILPPEEGAGGFGFPAQTVLIDRFLGEVKVEREEPKQP